MALPQGNQQVEFKRPETIDVPSIIGTYYKLSVLGDVRKTLMEVGGRQLFYRFEEGCFGKFLRWNPGQKCGMVVHHVLSREIVMPGAEEHEMWFELNGAHVRFGHIEFALVTGLKFGSSEVETTGEYELSHVNAYHLFSGGGDITVAKLLEKFRGRRIDDPTGESYFRVAHVLVLYLFLLAYDPNHYVDEWVWALLGDMNYFNDFPWGAYAFLTLEHYVKNISHNKRYHFNGAVWAFHVWSLEIMPELAEFVAAKVEDQEAAHPRFLRWKFRSRIKDNIAPIFQQEADSVVPMEMDAEEMASPYMQSALGQDPLGIMFHPPRNPVKLREHCPRRVIVPSDSGTDEEESDSSKSEDSVEAHARGKKRPSKGKRPRQETSTSTGSSGGVNEAESFNRNETRFMKKTAELTYKKMKKRFLPKIKRWFDELKEMMSCSNSRGFRDVDPRRPPRPAPRRPPHVDDDDDDDDDDGDAGNMSIHVSTGMPHASTPTSLGFDFMGSGGWREVPVSMEQFGRHSVHDIGHTFMPTSDVEIPGRHSMHDFDRSRSPLDHLCESIFGSNAGPTYTFTTPITAHEQSRMNDPSGKGKGVADDDDDDLNIPIRELRRNPRRARVPSRALSSPYVNNREPRPVPKDVQVGYEQFKSDPGRSNVQMKETAHVLPKSFFRLLELPTTDFDCSTVDLYLMHLRSRLINKDHLLETVDESNTIILDTDVFISLAGCWEDLKDSSDDVIAAWEPPNHILRSVEGIDAGSTMRPWYSAKQIILVCFLNGHFVTVRISLANWTAELYDSLYYVRDHTVQAYRETQLEPLVRLFPRVLAASDFWENQTSGHNIRYDPLTLKVIGRQSQQLQVGSMDCGPLALMCVERLLTGSPSTHWGNSHVGDYRKMIAQSIFNLCEDSVDSE